MGGAEQRTAERVEHQTAGEAGQREEHNSGMLAKRCCSFTGDPFPCFTCATTTE